MSQYERVCQAARVLLERAPRKPRAALVLGSGWGELVGGIEGAVHLPYREVPGMKASTVPGHAGEWVLGEMNGTAVAVMSGRLHYYEGHALEDVVFPVRVMRQMGVEALVLTNAAGAVNTAFAPGDLMLVSDHINLTGTNPLFGPNEERFGPRFPDMSKAYDPQLRALARSCAREAGIEPREGVYCWMTGPSFETPAEIRMARALGADAVGMSTVPEVICARHMGLKVIAASCMTNMAAGVLDQPLSHQEVLETMERVKPAFSRFLYNLMGKLRDEKLAD